MAEKTQDSDFKRPSHIRLTSHQEQVSRAVIPINWGVRDPKQRGPVVGSISDKLSRNVIGTHSGSYTVYRALSIAAGQFPASHRPDLSNTSPTTPFGPFDSWFDPAKIVSLDPWGAHVYEVFRDTIDKGLDVRPTIAVTTAHLQIPELAEAIDKGRLKIDGKVVTERKDIKVTKVALEPVWYLPGIAKRMNTHEGELRKILFQETGGMFPELVTRPDLKVLLPPIGSTTAYIFGNPADLANQKVELTCRVHDECNGSDVFGSDICTCRPYLTYGLEMAVKAAQEGQVGLVVYFRKEGRALGEVTKFLVYNARKRQMGGDSAATYFHRTECVAGVQDARFQELMPDVLHYFGIKTIHHLHSMSNMKYNAIAGSGIKVVNRISIPDHLVPEDAHVEMEAKKAAGYFTKDEVKQGDILEKVKGRKLNE
jgi:GTP cyclohydrolase II